MTHYPIILVALLVAAIIEGCAAMDRYPCDEPAYVPAAPENPDPKPFVNPDCSMDTRGGISSHSNGV